MKECISIKQASRLLDRSEDVVRRLCKIDTIVSYLVVIKEIHVVVIPKEDFLIWLKNLKPRPEKIANKKEFTMNCFSFACTRDSSPTKSVVITENKFLQECPKCKCILVKRKKNVS